MVIGWFYAKLIGFEFLDSTFDLLIPGQKNVHCRYIIEGYTEDGRKFRPSDWIDRIASMMASYGSAHRLVFSDLLHPELYEGQKCLIIDTELEIKNPIMFQYVMNFVKSNNLKMTQVCDATESKLGS